MIFAFYRFIIIPLTLFFLNLLRPFLGNKIQQMLEERTSPNWPEMTASPVWIHASSGEIEYAKPLIREIKLKWPQRPILLTYFSPSAKKLLSGIEGVEVILPLPWDQRTTMKRFIQHFHPEVLLIARTDVWSECVYQCKLKNIPSILFSATLAENSSRKNFFAKSLTRFAINHLTEILCVTEEDASQFRSLGVHIPIEVAGDTRYDQVLWRLNHPKNIRTELKPNSHPIFVAGSTWPADEKELFPALPKFIAKGGRVILAPHEVTESHLASLENQLSELKMNSVRYSKANMNWTQEFNILIIDQVGILAEIYTWGDMALVGGSFKDRVHSVMEPLAAGLPTMVGPRHTNNREALHFQNIILDHSNSKLLNAVTVVKNSEDISNSLEMINVAHTAHPEIKKNLQKKVESLSGSTVKIIRKLSLLKTS